MEKIFCPACLSQEKLKLRLWLGEKKDLLKCKSCGLYFFWPKPPLQEILQIYRRHYYNAWPTADLGGEGLAEMKQATFRILLERIEKYKNKGKLLDVGCAFGHLLDVAKLKGWDCYGVEITDDSYKKAKEKFGEGRIFSGDFLGIALPPKTFDVITMVDVIEHFYEVQSVLKRCGDLLKDGGLLVLVTPDIHGFLYKCLRRYWPHFKTEHLIFFSKTSAAGILEINNFRALEISSFKKSLNLLYIKSIIRAYSQKPVASFAQFMINLLPESLKFRNFFPPQGEILIIAQKKNL